MTIGPSTDAPKLLELIKKAIDDGVVTHKEYNQILILADADGEIDPQERALLAQLNQMIGDGTVKRTA